jgi:hypothetical protein
MNKYILEFANGNKSAWALTKEQVVKALNNWYKKEGWSFITVTNIKNGKSNVFFEDWKIKNVTDDMLTV